MCYDVSFTISLKQLSDYFPDMIFDDQMDLQFTATHIMGHSFGDHPIIYRNREDGLLHCKLMEWGVIPHYTKDLDGFKKRRATMLNIRSERILDDKASYWNKIRTRRCLIPLTGFYEHREVPKFKNKIPYYLKLTEQPMFFVPGLYSAHDVVDTESGEVLKQYTYALITRNANPLMAQIHNGGDNAGRMPLLLPLSWAQKWLDAELTDDEYRSILAFEMPSEALCYRPVFTIRGRSPRPDEKEKDAVYEWENLPDLAY
ncbi:MAG: SOS response-associated peptidase family protein [Bacteroidota bacterium]